MLVKRGHEACCDSVAPMMPHAESHAGRVALLGGRWHNVCCVVQTARGLGPGVVYPFEEAVVCFHLLSLSRRVRLVKALL